MKNLLYALKVFLRCSSKGECPLDHTYAVGSRSLVYTAFTCDDKLMSLIVNHAAQDNQ